jgi:hypothetical protein
MDLPHQFLNFQMEWLRSRRIKNKNIWRLKGFLKAGGKTEAKLKVIGDEIFYK